MRDTPADIAITFLFCGKPVVTFVNVVTYSLYIGKPNKVIVEMCLNQTKFTKEQTLVIGDRLYTDIACGINGAVDTCVVFTGEATRDDIVNTEFKPTYSFDTIKELYEEISFKRYSF